jgi:protein arginine N-methyltransferase 1
MYSVYFYGQMLADTPRLRAYVKALKRSVKPGAVVIDLGCGPGFFALLACQLGARRVYAIEPDDVIQVAREAAMANGYAERIEFFQDFSTEITTSEPADIIVSDLRGVVPWYQENIPSIVDARTRLLANSGVLIPRCDRLWASIVEAPECYDEIVDPWEGKDLDLSAAKRVVTNTWRKARINSDQLLASPVCCYKLDYNEVETSDLETNALLEVNRSGTSHGFAIWFDSELIDGVGFSNNPQEPELVYGQGFFPLPHPVAIEQGDRIQLSLKANLVRGNYVWRWDTTILAGESLQPRASFRQSTLSGVPLSPVQLRKQSAGYKPTLTEAGQVRSFIMESMTGDNSLEEIATRLVERFPKRYADWKSALDDVTEVSLEFGK